MYEYVIDTIEMVSRGLQWRPAVEPGEVITHRAAQGWRFLSTTVEKGASSDGRKGGHAITMEG